MFQFMLYFM